jgi:starch phosphorylase
VAIPELMRILMDWEKLTWDEAWAITTKTCAYTNHTILAEALEKWSIGLFAGLLPRIYMIVEEIQRRFVDGIRSKYGNNHAKIKELSIISEGVIKMAWLAIHGSHSVNGVAALHTEI